MRVVKKESSKTSALNHAQRMKDIWEAEGTQHAVTQSTPLNFRGDSLLKWRIFPRARNRKSETSFPPIHCSASPGPFSLDRFFPCVLLHAALPGNTARHFSFFGSDSPLSDEKGGPLGHWCYITRPQLKRRPTHTFINYLTEQQSKKLNH